MTNEEAIKSLKKLKSFHNGSYGAVIDMAIKVLEQQPCEDCISREEAIRFAEQGQIQGYEWQFKKLCNLPSVTPTRPHGEWIDIGMWLEGRKYGKEHGEMIDAYSCDYCGYSQYHKTNFCPYCGADMREVKANE